MTEEIYETNSAEETRELGKKLVSTFSGDAVVAMYGTLGAGKTAFVSGAAEGLSCMQTASSPTYTVVNEYYGTRRICHFDMYRLTDESQLYDIGWEDYLASGALCFVEWSENVEGAIPDDAVKIYFEKNGENSRKIKVIRC